MTDHMAPRLKLRPLLRAASRVFDIEENLLRADQRWKPLTHFRHLAWLVAREAGFGPAEIGRVFGFDQKSVKGGIAHAREQVRLHDWWARRKAELVDAWDEELARTD